MPRTVCLIQARDGSTRFPMKIWQELNGEAVITRVSTQAQKIKGLTDCRVIYPTHFPGLDEEDVLGRYATAAEIYGADIIIRITGDCPLFDPRIGDLLLERMGQGVIYDYVSNVWPIRTWPDGLDCEVFTRDILDRANKEATDPYDREHVTPWIRRNCRTYYNLTLPIDWSHVRLTVDYPEDLDWLRIALKAPQSQPLPVSR